MVTTSLGKRMRKLRSLLDIRLGPGAAILSPSVTRIHLNFARRMNDGHLGPRKFWHHYLPRLKYHNPSIPMTVERTDDNEGPASLTVFFGGSEATQSTSGDKAPSDYVSPDNTKMIDMKHKKEGDILEQVMRLCEGRQVQATEAEKVQLRELEEDRVGSEQARVQQKKVVEARKRQQAILDQAKATMETG